jgi:hypothetical protein
MDERDGIQWHAPDLLQCKHVLQASHIGPEILHNTTSKNHVGKMSFFSELTDSMEQSSSEEANSHSASHEISLLLWNPKVH